MIGELFRRLQYYLHRRRFEDELNEEIDHHLSMMERDTGAAQARRQFGNPTRWKEESRDRWAWRLLEQLAQDLRYTLRTMSSNRAFTALAVLSLALGIGANTAIYSFMDAILLRSLPVSDPESLVMLNWRAKSAWGDGNVSVFKSGMGQTYADPKWGVTGAIFPYAAFELFANNDTIFSNVFAYYPSRTMHLAAEGKADLVTAEFVSGDYFRGLAVVPAAGRLILPDDDRAGAAAVVVCSFAYSQRRFGDPEKASGQTVLINSLPFTVAGVAPPGFFGLDPGAMPDIFVPMHMNVPLGALDQFGFPASAYLDAHFYWVEVMGRLRPGVSLEAAQTALAPQFHRWVASTAENDSQRANLPALDLKSGARGLDNVRRKFSKPLYLLMTLVGLILAIACANVANLLLARAAARKREIALRLSVGAGRGRVVRQLITESVLLASLGGALGVLLAVWGIHFLTALLANGDPRFTLHAELNWRVLSLAAALSLATGVLFGLAPAMQLTRTDVISAMKETRAGQMTRRVAMFRVSLSHALIVTQIALSLLMLVAAGLFVRTLTNLQSVELGFNRESLLLLQLNARQSGYKGPAIAAFYADLLNRLRSIPGVRDASLANSSLIGAGFGLSLNACGAPASLKTRIMTVGPSFFKTMQIPILAGREIGDQDQPGSPPVAVINEEFAKVNCAGRNPLGQRVSIRGRQREMEIAGVSRNARYGELKDDFRPVIYLPYNQGFPQPEQMIYALRTAGDPLGLVGSAREIIHQMDGRVPLARVMTQSAQIDQSINQAIVFARLCTGFAILALVIACVGLYGTVSYNVARRTGEIGVRMALGARRGRVVAMILKQVFLLAAVGLAIGLPVAFAASKLVSSFLFGMKPNDPRALLGAVAILLGAAVLAGYGPARRASRIDPVVALRHE